MAWMYRGATGCRNWFYDRKLFRVQQVESKVIAIGNLTLGGTGKTPVTLALLEGLQARGYSCGVVSRGYKRAQKGVLEVTMDPLAANTFGDEPALIKASYPEVPVVVGEKRSAAAQALLSQRKVDFILCDDGFQHRRLGRDLDLVLLDALDPFGGGRIFPRGLLREPIASLKRAGIVILSRADLIQPAERAAILKNQHGVMTTDALPYNVSPAARITVGEYLGRDYLDRDRSLEFTYYGGLSFYQRDAWNAVINDSYQTYLVTPLSDATPGFTGAQQFLTTDTATLYRDIHKEPSGSYVASGSINVRTLNRRLGWSLPTEGPRTLNGLIFEHLESIPEPGISLKIGSYTIEIIQIIDNVVKMARIRSL